MKTIKAAPLAPAASYLRVSTQRQGQSGLGIEAQREAVARYLGDRALVREIVETESGRRSDRPKLREALAYCRQHGAMLIVAKLDRLSRNVRFLAELLEAGIDIHFCDLPQADKFQLHIMAAVAEHEAKLIAQRTRAALQAARARGTRLGFASPKRRRNGPSPRETSRLSARVRSAAADERAARMVPILARLERVGIVSLSGIAAHLNAMSVPTPRAGGQWHAATVRLLKLRLARVQQQRIAA